MRRRLRTSAPGPRARGAARAGGWGEVSRRALPNGLSVLAAPAPRLHSAVIALYARAGSRHETRRTNGVSHLLEHLLFRGSEGWPDTASMNAAVEAAGGSLNAVTARDHCCYYTAIDPAALSTGLAVLGDLVRRPLLSGLEVEREIILEEILDEVDARGRDIDPDNLLKHLVFRDHPLGFKIGGTARSVRRLGEAEVRAHHRRLYVGANLVLCVAGPVGEREVADLAADHLGALPRGRAAEERPPPPWPRGPRLVQVGHADAQAELSLAFPSPPEADPDFPAHLCLRRLLDDGLSARLPFEIVERRGLAYSIHAGLDTFSDAGMITVEGACAPRKVTRVVEEVLRVLAGLAEREVPEGELARVQRRHRLALAFSLDSAADIAGWHGSGELMGAREGFEERCLRVEAVGPADVLRAARATFTRRNLAAVVVGPAGRRERAELERLLEAGGGLPAGP